MNAIADKIKLFAKKWLEARAATITHSEIIKNIHHEMELTPSYFVFLILANLIALSGLIQNSTPVIIGAMLISPLMGPILSFGFAFITGDKIVWRESVRKLIISIVVTIVIAAIATFISPLKDITNEIIARTKPNLYDLLIAFFSGLAGAVALCTRKNYLTIVPGVAIATAVIPPLSVAGFGLGIADFNLSLGSFLLFFTNFVAIVISTCIVFYIYGFKPSIITDADVSALKKRVSYLAVVLFVISIPLIYTLHKSISEVRIKTNMQNILKRELDRAGTSRLSAFSYITSEVGKLEINATINTVTYLKETEINNIEKKIKDSLEKDLVLYVEQIKVQPGGLKESSVKGPSVGIIPAKPTQDIIRTSRENMIAVVRQSVAKIEKIISPSTVTGFNVGFNDKTFNISIAMKIKRDSPLSGDEILWLKNFLSSDLNVPVDIAVETVPFVPILIFNNSEAIISDEMRKALISIKNIYQKNPDIGVIISSYTGTTVSSVAKQKLAKKRAEQVADIIEKEYVIPNKKIRTFIHKSKKTEAPVVQVTIKMKD